MSGATSAMVAMALLRLLELFRPYSNSPREERILGDTPETPVGIRPLQRRSYRCSPAQRTLGTASCRRAGRESGWSDPGFRQARRATGASPAAAAPCGRAGG